jgi:hypothetical protein
MNVAMEHNEQVLFTWDSGFCNNELGDTDHVLGTDGTLFRSQQLRYIRRSEPADGKEALGQSKTEPHAHMQDFLEAIRTDAKPTARSNWVSAPPSPAAWPSKATARSARFIGIRQGRNQLAGEIH